MEEILGFSKVEYLVAFHAIITGFVASEFFVGGGEVIRQHHGLRDSFKFLLYTFLSFSLLLIFWWNIWNRSMIISLTIVDFMRILPYSIIFYIITVVLFKELRESKVGNLNYHFTKHRKTLFALAGAYFIYDHLDSIDHSDVAFRYAGMFFCAIGYVFAHKLVQIPLLFFGVFVTACYIVWSFFNQITQDPTINEYYSKVEHLAIFLTFLFGFVVSEFLKGWADMFYKKSGSKFSLTHFLWTLFAFFLLVDIWWGSWSQKALIVESLVNFLILLVSPFAIYLLSVFFFPKTGPDKVDYEEVFMKNKQYIFLCFTGFFLVNILVTLIFDHFWEETRENTFRAVAVILSLVAWRVHSLIFHKVLIIVSTLMLVINLLLSTP